MKDRVLDSTAFIDLYEEMINEHPICSLEDPFDQDDFDAYIAM